MDTAGTAHATTRDTILLTHEDEALLLVIFEVQEPVGARLAARLLHKKGLDLSEASVSRAFTRLDSMGLTIGQSRKGRIPTDAGRQLIAERIGRERRDAIFNRALDLRNVEEILDWIKARQLLETQAAELAATKITDEQLSELEKSLDEHVGKLAYGSDPTPISLHFHKILMEASCSPIFIALIGSLYTPQLITIERALDIILNSRGTMGDSATEHAAILDAIRSRDPVAAGKAMSHHLSRLRTEAERFADDIATGNLLEILHLINARASS